MQKTEQLKPFKTRSGDTLEILYLEDLSAEVSVDLFHILNAVCFVLFVFLWEKTQVCSNIQYSNIRFL